MNSSRCIYKLLVGTAIAACMFAIYYTCKTGCTSNDGEVVSHLQGRCSYEKAGSATWSSLGWPPSQSECLQVVSLDVSGQNLSRREWDQVARVDNLVVFQCHGSNVPAEILGRMCQKPKLHEVWVGPGVEEELLITCLANPNIYVVVLDRSLVTFSLFQHIEKHVGAVFVVDGDKLYRAHGLKIGLAGQHCFHEFDWNQ